MQTKGWKARQAEAVRIGLVKNVVAAWDARKRRQYAAELAVPEALLRARPLADELMDCVDRLGSEFGSVDPRVWDHLLVYAPKEKIAEWAAAIAA